MSILGKARVGLIGKESEVRKWIETNLHLAEKNYSLREKKEGEQTRTRYVIDVNGQDVNLALYPDPVLPNYIQFGEIIGANFICSYSKLNSTQGFPKMVGLNFDCSFSQLRSLEGMPELVDKDFVCCGLPFTKDEIASKIKVTCNIYC